MVDTPPRPLLILDVDETLIFGADEELDRPADFRVGPFHVYCRPHLTDFFRRASQQFDLAIWSSATLDYVSEIAAAICPAEVNWKFVWGRERCTPRIHAELFETVYFKDLKKVKRLGFDLDRVLFVDDTAGKLARNYGNAIYVSPFTGDQSDRELPLLLRFLESIQGAVNYRAIEKRGWRTWS